MLRTLWVHNRKAKIVLMIDFCVHEEQNNPKEFTEEEDFGVDIDGWVSNGS
jgi:hypothetical protein